VHRIAVDKEHHGKWKSIEEHALDLRSKPHSRVIHANESLLGESSIDRFNLRGEPQRDLDAGVFGVVERLRLSFINCGFVNENRARH